MTHVKIAEAYSRIVGICTGFGGTYNPGRPTLRIDALNTKKAEAYNALAHVVSAKAQYDNQVNQRKQFFGQLPTLASSVLLTLEASGASPEKLNDARSFVRQITGSSTKKKVLSPDASPAATPAASVQPPKAKHSTLQLAYASKADSFAKLVEAVSTEPLYQANEATLSVSGLTDMQNQLNNLNASVNDARVAWSNALISRNDVMYRQAQSIYNTGRAVKKYVRAIFGKNSEQFAQVKSLQFTKPAM